MLQLLRDERGKPSLAVRGLAAAVALGLIALAAPAVVAVMRWASALLF